MNQKGFVNIILILVLIAIAGVAGYFVLMKKPTPVIPQTPTPTQVSVMQQPTPAASTPSSETANWKTYRNGKYGFEVKYPPEWKILNEGETSYGNTSGFNVQFGISQVQVATEIEVFEATPDESAAKAFQRITTIDPNALVKNNIMVAGVRGEYYKDVPGNVPYDEAMLTYKNRFYGLIRYSAENGAFASFLSTFRFIQ